MGGQVSTEEGFRGDRYRHSCPRIQVGLYEVIFQNLFFSYLLFLLLFFVVVVLFCFGIDDLHFPRRTPPVGM